MKNIDILEEEGHVHYHLSAMSKAASCQRLIGPKKPCAPCGLDNHFDEEGTIHADYRNMLNMPEEFEGRGPIRGNTRKYAGNVRRAKT